MEAEPPAEFRAERRGEAWLVQGPFIARRRGQERLIPATCTVLGKTVLRLTIP